MNEYLSIPSLFLILLCVSSSFGQDKKEPNIQAKIQLESRERILSISAVAINNAPEDYRLGYKLSVITGSEDNSNSSKNTQSGSFLLASYDTKMLSRTSIFQNPGNKAEIYLHIIKENKVVARDSVTFQF